VLLYAVDEAADPHRTDKDEDGKERSFPNWLRLLPELLPVAVDADMKTLREMHKKTDSMYPVYVLDRDTIRGWDFRRTENS